MEVVEFKLKELTKQVLEICKIMYESKLVTGNSGNASIRDAENRYIAIKPSGISYQKMKIEDATQRLREIPSVKEKVRKLEIALHLTNDRKEK